MKITFIGTGYVGLVSGVMLSHLGHTVTCLDVDKNKIKNLQNAVSPIFEPGLDEYIKKCIYNNQLNFVDSYNSELGSAECIFITVGTPSMPSGGADLTGVFKSIEQVCEYINPNTVIVVKSTVPPGTCLEVQKFLKEKGLANLVVSNPEFLREGSAILDFLEPDRIVIGATDGNAFTIMQEVYQPLTKNNVPIVETDLKTSELIKYAANAFLANKIAFINEMADLCELVGADIMELAKGIGLDKRIGSYFLNPGPGFGGSCFPKDILALQQLYQQYHGKSDILNAVITANNSRSGAMIDKIKNAVGGSVKGKKLAILGLTYKAGTDDLRDSPAIPLINTLQTMEADVIAYDPQGIVNAHKYFVKLMCATSMQEALKDADALVIVTEWPEFKTIDLQQAKNNMRAAIIIDLRNILNAEIVTDAGFHYYCVGKTSE